MRRPLRRLLSPRAYKAGAFYVGAPAWSAIPLLGAALAVVALYIAAAMASAALLPSAALAQIGSVACLPPDSLVAGVDSAGPPPVGAPPVGAPTGLAEADSGPILAPSDSVEILAEADSIEILAEADSIEILADSAMATLKILPSISSGREPSYSLGIWCWDRDDLLSTRAVTLAELVSLIPGVIALRGGDFGTPATVSAFGGGGGRLRIVWDGFEWLPLQGAVHDLSRIGLAGLGEVRVERHPGELVIALKTREPTDPDPASIVHVGTGDLGTNLLRGVFVHPTAFRGSFTFALDRLETRGPGLEASGSLSGFALRYGILRGNQGGIVAELRRFAARTDVADLTTGLTRNDWNIRARWRLAEGLVGEGFWGASSLSGGPEDPIYGGLDTRRTQLGLRTEYTVGNLWGKAAARRFSGDGVADANFEVAAGGSHALGALDGSVRAERWGGQYVMSWRARIETASFKGFSLFAAFEDGETGTPFVGEYEAYLRSLRLGPPPQPTPVEEPRPRFTKRTGIRAGGTFAWRDFSVSGALLSLEVDSLRPLGLILDPEGVTVAGGDRTGFEATARLPLPISGFALQGAFQAWDDGLPYLPRRLLDGALTYHGIFKESRNLEVWGSAGVRHRDAMSIGILQPGGDPTVPDLVEVPFLEEWYTHIQVRIVTVSLFLRFENIRRKSDNIDFPNRRQPQYRSFYGVNWTLNN